MGVEGVAIRIHPDDGQEDESGWMTESGCFVRGLSRLRKTVMRGGHMLNPSSSNVRGFGIGFFDR